MNGVLNFNAIDLLVLITSILASTKVIHAWDGAAYGFIYLCICFDW